MIASLKGLKKALKESVDRGGRYSSAYGSETFMNRVWLGWLDGDTERDNGNPSLIHPLILDRVKESSCQNDDLYRNLHITPIIALCLALNKHEFRALNFQIGLN